MRLDELRIPNGGLAQLGERGHVQPYIGGYTDYEEALQAKHASEQSERAKAAGKAAAATSAQTIASEKAGQAAPAKTKLTYAERLELQKLEQEMARSEAELKMLAVEMNNCGSNYGKLAELTARQQELSPTIHRISSLICFTYDGAVYPAASSPYRY